MDKRLTCSVCGALALGILCEHLEPLLARGPQPHPVHEFHGVGGLLVTPGGVTSSVRAL